MNLIKEHLSMIVTIAAITGAVATLAAYFLKANELIVSSTIFLFTVIIVLFGMWGWSYFNQVQGQNILYTFFWDDLLPNTLKKFLGLKTDIVIIEASENPTFLESLHKQFPDMKDLDVTRFPNMPEVRIVIFPNMPELKFTLFVCDSSDVVLQEGRLVDSLSGAQSVIVVRTVELDQKDWVYKALEAWAFRNSHAPCLVIDKIDPKELSKLKLNPIPERYFFIPDDVSSLPWRLLKRANERAFAWRNQASFNRLIAMTGLCLAVLLLTGLTIGYFSLSRQRRESASSRAQLLNDQSSRFKDLEESQRLENLIQLRGLYTASNKPELLEIVFRGIVSQTRDHYRELFVKDVKDETLEVSYWVSLNGNLHQLATTEKKKRGDLTIFENNKASIIGCAFAYPNSWVDHSNKPGRPIIRHFNEVESPEGNRCQYQHIEDAKIKFMVCSSYDPSPDKKLEKTVGICVFTLNEDHDILTYKHDGFLRDRTREFYEFVAPTISAKKLPLPWRDPYEIAN